MQMTTLAHANMPEFIFKQRVIYPYPYKGEGEVR